MAKRAPEYEEKIAIVPKLDGTYEATVSWRGQTWIEPLPRGIQDWSKDEFMAHLRRFVVPKMRLYVLKAQRQALEQGTAAPEEVLVTRTISPEEAKIMVKAEEKRQRKAAIRVIN